MLFLVPVLLLAQSLEISADRESAIYKVNETATLSLLVKDAQGAVAKEGKLTVELNNFGPLKISNQVFDLADANPVRVSGTLKVPGFMLCEAKAHVDGKNATTYFGAAYSPEQIKPGSKRPVDFDQFWDAAVRKLDAQVPADPKIERFPQYCTDKYESFKVSFATFGNKRVYGFLCVPKGKGKFPVLVNVPGAGPGYANPQTTWAEQGFISFVMNVHPFEPAANKKEQKKLYEEQDVRLREIYGVRYCQSGARSREEYFFYPIILGINRAVNWLSERGDIDKSRFLYMGSSQGGGFGLYLCGLNRNFTKGVIHVPALTDLMGYKEERWSGWPKLIESVPSEDKKSAEKLAPYFDGAHFAYRIKCPVRLSVGFIDRTCPPAAVYAGYNSLTVKDRDIMNVVNMPHAVYPELRKKLDEAWLKQ